MLDRNSCVIACNQYIKNPYNRNYTDQLKSLSSPIWFNWACRMCRLFATVVMASGPRMFRAIASIVVQLLPSLFLIFVFIKVYV